MSRTATLQAWATLVPRGQGLHSLGSGLCLLSILRHGSCRCISGAESLPTLLPKPGPLCMRVECQEAGETWAGQPGKHEISLPERAQHASIRAPGLGQGWWGS